MKRARAMDPPRKHCLKERRRREEGPRRELVRGSGEREKERGGGGAKRNGESVLRGEGRYSREGGRNPRGSERDSVRGQERGDRACATERREWSRALVREARRS